MKSYRVQIRSEGKYYNGIIKADNDVLALQQFEKKLTNGEIKAQDEDFYNKTRVFITYEELKNGTTNANIGEASVGVQMGKSSVITG
jgi:AMMECR1 domain-containing protein|tara:strand:- start:737 stop:997 length:261 start_codon:yes stop_codon:yes gene_type:complete